MSFTVRAPFLKASLIAPAVTSMQVHITFSSDIVHHPFENRVCRNGEIMQEVFSKIIEKLEERKQLHERMIAYESKNGTAILYVEKRKVRNIR